MNKFILFISVLVVAFLFNPIFSYSIGTIDFELFPDGTLPQDKMEIHDQFKDSHGVIFSLSNGENPKLAKIGSPMTAFQGYEFKDDTPAPNQNVGQYFLTDDTVVGAPAGDLIISYINPVKSAAGVIIDIDHSEKWNIIAYDTGGNKIEQISLPNDVAKTGEGIATNWSFNVGSDSISSIKIVADTASSSAFGLAFDNFSPSSSSFAPVANAGPDQIVEREVLLDGSKSYDLYGGEIVSYHWEIKYRGNTAYNANAVGINPTITNLEPGFYDATLTVTDNDGLTASDDITIAVTLNKNSCEGVCLTQEQINSIIECMELVKQILSGDKRIGLKDAIRALETVAGIKK